MGLAFGDDAPGQNRPDLGQERQFLGRREIRVDAKTRRAGPLGAQPLNGIRFRHVLCHILGTTLNDRGDRKAHDGEREAQEQSLNVGPIDDRSARTVTAQRLVFQTVCLSGLVHRLFTRNSTQVLHLTKVFRGQRVAARIAVAHFWSIAISIASAPSVESPVNVSLPREYAAVVPDASMEDDCRQLIRLAVREDLDRALDWTTVCLIDQNSRGRCDVVPREKGVCAGIVTIPWIIDEMDADLQLETRIQDGEPLAAGQPMLRLAGSARDLLTCERLILNLLSRLCGVATLTSRFVERLDRTGARLYDTRKTTPGYRRLEKYAVACGGGHNHRTGLFDGFLVKDNHLALGGSVVDGKRSPLSPRVAAERTRAWAGSRTEGLQAPEMVEIEVDSLEQLAEVLPARPDIVLVDNFSVAQLRDAVAMRNQLAPEVELEASGNVRIDTIGEIASTGVERISSGALTHQAVWLDLGLDWSDENAS